MLTHQSLAGNVRRYVALASRCIGTVARRAPYRSANWRRRSGCFCTRCAMQDYDVVLFIVALAKTVTPVGVPGGSRGRPHRRPLNVLLWPEDSRGAEKPMTYTDLLATVACSNINLCTATSDNGIYSPVNLLTLSSI